MLDEKTLRLILIISLLFFSSCALYVWVAKDLDIHVHDCYPNSEQLNESLLYPPYQESDPTRFSL